MENFEELEIRAWLRRTDKALRVVLTRQRNQEPRKLSKVRNLLIGKGTFESDHFQTVR